MYVYSIHIYICTQTHYWFSHLLYICTKLENSKSHYSSIEMLARSQYLLQKMLIIWVQYWPRIIVQFLVQTTYRMLSDSIFKIYYIFFKTGNWMILKESLKHYLVEFKSIKYVFSISTIFRCGLLIYFIQPKWLYSQASDYILLKHVALPSHLKSF